MCDWPLRKDPTPLADLALPLCLHNPSRHMPPRTSTALVRGKDCASALTASLRQIL
jgi:hypothetical protein